MVIKTNKQPKTLINLPFTGSGSNRETHSQYTKQGLYIKFYFVHQAQRSTVAWTSLDTSNRL